MVITLFRAGGPDGRRRCGNDGILRSVQGQLVPI